MILQLLCSPIGNPNFREKTEQNMMKRGDAPDRRSSCTEQKVSPSGLMTYPFHECADVLRRGDLLLALPGPLDQPAPALARRGLLRLPLLAAHQQRRRRQTDLLIVNVQIMSQI